MRFVLFNAMINGSSEMISEVSSGVKTLVFNYIIIRYAGEAGVAASFLINEINILGSAFFTSVNNGKISALMSTLRTFVFTLGFVAVLPIFMGMDGVWLSIPAAEAVTLLVTFYFMMKYKGVYLGIKETAPSTVSSLI